MTPASYRKGGAGALVRYIVTESALGGLLLAGTSRGVCAVKLGDDTGALAAELEQEFPAATLQRAELDGGSPDTAGLRSWTNAALAYLDGRSIDIDLPLDVRATMFQWRVWRQLQAIPVGETRTYQQLAEKLEHPKAAEPWDAPAPPTPWRPSSPATARCERTAGLPATAGVCTGKRPCFLWSAASPPQSPPGAIPARSLQVRIPSHGV